MERGVDYAVGYFGKVVKKWKERRKPCSSHPGDTLKVHPRPDTSVVALLGSNYANQ